MPDTATATARFHIGDLLSVTDGRLVSPNHIGGVYNVVDFVTGIPHMTHQLPRAMQVVGPWVLEQHPWLADVAFDYEIPDGATNDEAMMAILGWLEGVAARYGERHLVEAMPLGMYVGREPIAEAVEMVGKDRVIVADLTGGSETGSNR